MSTLRTDTILDSLGGNNTTINGLLLNAGALEPDDRIINGDFGVWQRGTNFTTFAYGADRWMNLFIGGTVTQSRQAFAVGDTIGNNNPQYFLRQTVSGQTLAGELAGVQQRIEGVRSYAGQTITVLGWARRSSGAGNIGISMQQTFGTGGSPSASVTAISPATITLTGSWAPFAVVINVPSITGKTLGTNGNDRLDLNIYTSTGTTYSGNSNGLGLQTIGLDLWGIHIKRGIHAVDVVDLYSPRDPGTELTLCQRYCSIVYVHLQGGSTGYILVPWYTPVTMRTTPVVAVISAGVSVLSTPLSDVSRYAGGGYFQAQLTGVNGYTVDRIYMCDAEL